MHPLDVEEDKVIKSWFLIICQACRVIHLPIFLYIHGYLSEPPTPRLESPLQYWKSNKFCLPALVQAARKYLSVPCTSGDSERLFSTASHAVDEKRNRILCEKVEMLLFVKKKNPSCPNEVDLDLTLVSNGNISVFHLL